MRAQVQTGERRQIGDAVLGSVEEFAGAAATQARKTTQTMAKGIREHPIAWAAGAAGLAALTGLLIARSAKH